MLQPQAQKYGAIPPQAQKQRRAEGGAPTICDRFAPEHSGRFDHLLLRPAKIPGIFPSWLSMPITERCVHSWLCIGLKVRTMRTLTFSAWNSTLFTTSYGSTP